jgi:hypothetical protein
MTSEKKPSKKEPRLETVTERKTFIVRADNIADVDPKNLAAAAADPFSSALRIVAAAEKRTTIGKAVDAADAWSGVSDALDSFSKKLRQNDLTHAEDMLMSQAVALQSLFVRMSEGALVETNPAHFDMKFRYALRAQSQCRTTLETLATIKNPPVVFARQANLSNGPQQINNTVAAPSRGRKNKTRQSELSGAEIELPKNTGTPALTCRADTPLATVGEIDGTADGGRQGAGVTERMEGRAASLAAGIGEGPARAEAGVDPLTARR